MLYESITAKSAYPANGRCSVCDGPRGGNQNNLTLPALILGLINQFNGESSPLTVFRLHIVRETISRDDSCAIENAAI